VNEDVTVNFTGTLFRFSNTYMLHRSLLNSKFEWEAHTLIRSGAIEVMTASHDYPMVIIASHGIRFCFFRKHHFWWASMWSKIW
jgi:hypothetical protein